MGQTKEDPMADAIITPARLRLLNSRLPAAEAAAHAEALETHRRAGGLTTPLRVTHFIAQVMTETAGLSRLCESFCYRDPARLDSVFSAVHGVADAKALIGKGAAAIANRVYGGRLGNGDEASGDGWRFRGRGYLQITGRANYRDFGWKIDMDLEAEPQQLEKPGPAAEASARYWLANGINAEADADDVVGVTRRINPALAGLDARRLWLSRARPLWLA
jgi:putative chitinase